MTHEIERVRAPQFHTQAADLIRRSHLSPAVQDAYVAVVRDRVMAIGQGSVGRP